MCHQRKPMMTRHQIFLAFLYFVIVLIVLPFFCNEKVYSLYYQADDAKNNRTDLINNEHRKKGVREYLKQIDPKDSLTFHISKVSEPVDNLIVVMAKRPNKVEDLTLTQLVAEVDRNIRNQKLYRNAMLICNTTRLPFHELNHLAQFYPVRMAVNNTKWKLFNSEEVKKHDFVECLKQGLTYVNSRYITLIRDVVVPYSGFLGVVNHVINKRITSSLVQGELLKNDRPWLFLHLHEPVTFRQYHLSCECVREILLLTCSGALLFYLAFRWLEGPLQRSYVRVTYAMYGALYFFTFALVIGRPYVTELRRMAAELYRVYEPPKPIHFSAMVLPSNILPGLLAQLNLVSCSVYSPFHELLDHMVNTMELPGYVVSPSLVRYVSRT